MLLAGSLVTIADMAAKVHCNNIHHNNNKKINNDDEKEKGTDKHSNK